MAGHLITFYSYKGGTGRSMAMASVATLLARQSAKTGGKGVLLVDWDLEAPGLHRYFRKHLTKTLGPASILDVLLQTRQGVIDLFGKIDSLVPATKPASRAEADQAAKDAVAALELKDYVIETDVPCLSLMTSGQFDETYSSRVNQFRWEELFQRAPRVFLDVAELWCASYDYVLVDSRTGLADTSGICTMLLPERLVVVFTPNRQSLTGVADLVGRAMEYRKQSDDLRPLVVFPLASRVEMAEPALKNQWRFGDSQAGIEGYQPLFETLLKDLYQLPECSLSLYFHEVQIQHVPRYAYGEEVAALSEGDGTASTTDSPTTERLSLSRSYEDFTDRLIYLQGPWEEWKLGQARKVAEETNLSCERTVSGLTSTDVDRMVRWLTRLVRVAQPNETIEDGRVSAGVRDFADDLMPHLQKLAKAGLLATNRDPTSGEETFSFVSDSMVRDWQRLRDVIEADREFLQWRQRLDVALIESKLSNHELAARLTGARYSEANDWLVRREEDLSHDEKWFIRASAVETAQQLETPFSPVDSNSQLYLERKTDQEAIRAIRGMGATILVIGPRGYGKTSLLNRIAKEAKNHGKKVAWLDFSTFGKITSLETFLAQFVVEVFDGFGLPPPLVFPSDIWRCTKEFETQLLRAFGLAVLVMDEVDAIAEARCAPEFLAMLRSWAGLSGRKPIWKRLDVVVASALDPSAFDGAAAGSPFNVGLRIVLGGFTLSEAAELNRLHGSPIGTTNMQKLVRLLGGAPDLVRRGLYAVAAGDVDPDALFFRALSESGPFGDRLTQLRAKPELLRQILVLADSGPVDPLLQPSLLKNGYARLEDGRLRPVGHLYSDFARKVYGPVSA